MSKSCRAVLLIGLAAVGCGKGAGSTNDAGGMPDQAADIDLAARDATTFDADPDLGSDAATRAVDDLADASHDASAPPDLLPSVPPLVGTPISPLFFAMNAWMPAAIGDATPGGKLEQLLCGSGWNDPSDVCVPAAISEAGVQLMRYGGISNDKNFVAAKSHPQHATLVKNLRALGIEPLIQVSYAAGQYTPQQAADLVTYLNVTHKLGVVHWSIANEPNMTKPPYNGQYGAQKISEYFKAFAVAMKNVDPTIEITGVDLNAYNASIMNALTAGPYDITGSFLGSDGKSHYYVDNLNFHTYKFTGDTSDAGGHQRQAVIDYPAAGFADNVQALADRAALANTAHLRAGDDALTISVTEMNVDYANPIYATADAEIRGVGAQSFLAGQYWASAINVGLRHGLSSLAFWSVAEGGGDDGVYDLGFVRVRDDATVAKRSTFHHFQMLAQSLRGVYAPATWTLNGAAEKNVTAFGARDLDRICVVILNQKSATPMSYRVRLDGKAPTGSEALAVVVAAQTAREYHSPDDAPLPPQSTALLVFDGAGGLQSRAIYSLDDALAGNAPTTTTF